MKCLLRAAHIGRNVSHMQWVPGQNPAAQLRAHHESRLAFFHGPTFVVLHTFRVAARGPQRHSMAGQWPRGQFTWHHLSDKENNYSKRSNDVYIKKHSCLVIKPHGWAITPCSLQNAQVISLTRRSFYPCVKCSSVYEFRRENVFKTAKNLIKMLFMLNAVF